jgi:hypothetical protein
VPASQIQPRRMRYRPYPSDRASDSSAIGADPIPGPTLGTRPPQITPSVAVGGEETTVRAERDRVDGPAARICADGEEYRPESDQAVSVTLAQVTLEP